MKIAIITPYADPEKGAAVIRVNSFSDYFSLKGHKVDLYAPFREGVKKADSVTRYKTRKELLKSLKKYDVVIGTSTLLYDIFRAMIFCKRNKIKFIMDSKEPFAHTYSNIGGFSRKKLFIYRNIEKMLYKFSDAVFILTEANRKYVIENFKADPKKLFLVPNGTEPEKVFRDVAEGQKIRKVFGIPKDAVVLVYTGGFGDEEVNTFIEKTAGLIKKHNVELLFVVAAKGKNEIKKLVDISRKNGIGKKLHIIRNVGYATMYKYLSAADIGILPWPKSLVFSLPVKILDYLAAQMPVLVNGPSEGSLYDFFRKYDVGYYSTDWSSFAKRFEKCLSDKQKFKSKGELGRKIVEKEFDRKNFSKKALDIIEKIAA